MKSLAVKIGSLLACAWGLEAAAAVSNIDPDEEIVFFPGTCLQRTGGEEWELTIAGCVFEPEKRRVGLRLLRETLGFERSRLTDAENATFESRAGLFLVDNERGKRVIVRVGNQELRCERSQKNGHFAGVFQLSNAEVSSNAVTGASGMTTLPFNAVLRAGDARIFSGEAFLFGNRGVTVVSDIDDTLKVSEVRDRDALLRNTFLNPMKPVTGMAELFAGWTNSGPIQFHYVSASPWQLYGPLSDFVRSNGFPSGIFLLKDFRWKDRTVRNLFMDPERYKLMRIETLLERFPERRFVLVGDSGERDPEAYGALARRYARQVARILIRDVTGEDQESERYRTAFHDIPADKVIVFKDPSEIPPLEISQGNEGQNPEAVPHP